MPPRGSGGSTSGFHRGAGSRHGGHVTGPQLVGCEHLLLGLAAETEGVAGQALRAQGAEHRTLRRAVVAALAGYVHLRAQSPAVPAATEDLVAEAVRRELAPVTERLTALERHVGVRP
jgi:ATP-dependent Clp protease ATP-binding subunit ClpA